MICEFCRGKTLKRKVKKQHWLHGKLFIIENVEAEVCTEWPGPQPNGLPPVAPQKLC